MDSQKDECCGCEACEDGTTHLSDCAVHNEPAYPKGPCDCGATARGSNSAKHLFLEWGIDEEENKIWAEARSPRGTKYGVNFSFQRDEPIGGVLDRCLGELSRLFEMEAVDAAALPSHLLQGE